MRLALSLFIFILINSSVAVSQRPVNDQSLYWTRYLNQLIISPTLYWTNEVDNRRFFNPDVQNQFIFHSHLHYKKDRWDFGSGLTCSWAFAQKPENGFRNVAAEIRPFVEINYEFPIRKFSIQSRFRVDSRFLEEDVEKNVFEESLHVVRFRYRVQLRFPVKRNEEGIALITLRIADEIMLNHIRNTFDQNRIYASSDFYLTKNLSMEAGYIYIFQQRFGDDEFFRRNVFRFSIFHKITLHR